MELGASTKFHSMYRPFFKMLAVFIVPISGQYFQSPFGRVVVSIFRDTIYGVDNLVPVCYGQFTSEAKTSCYVCNKQSFSGHLDPPALVVSVLVTLYSCKWSLSSKNRVQYAVNF